MAKGLKWLLEPIDRWLWRFGVQFGWILCGKADTPSPPDPYVTAGAQTTANKDTALFNAQLNRINQNTPLGSLTYTQTPSFDQAGYDADMARYKAQLDAYTAASKANPQAAWTSSSGVGGWHAPLQAPIAPDRSKYQGSPTWTSTVNLSPQEQKIFDQQTNNSLSTSQLAGGLKDQVQSMLGNPITSVNQDEVTNAIMSRLDPRFEQDENALRTRLSNMGMTPGTEAWDNEFRNFNQQKNDARMQAVLSANQYAGQNLQNQQLQRSMPLNEMLALKNGTQLQMPQFSPAGQSQAAPTNISDLIEQNYQGQVANANAESAQQNQTMGSLASLAAMAIMFSDRRVKEDIKRVGKMDDGTPIYTYKYKGAGPRHFMGVMAQDIEDKKPDAVMEIGGIKAVDYGAI